MSVYKSKKSAPYWWYDFQISGQRFRWLDAAQITEAKNDCRSPRRGSMDGGAVRPAPGFQVSTSSFWSAPAPVGQRTSRPRMRST